MNVVETTYNLASWSHWRLHSVGLHSAFGFSSPAGQRCIFTLPLICSPLNLISHDSHSLTTIPHKKISINFWRTRSTRSDANIHSHPTFHLLGLLLRSFMSSGGNRQASSSLRRRQSNTSAETLTNFQHAVWMSFAVFSLPGAKKTCHTQT